MIERLPDRPGHLEGEADHDGPLNTFVIRSTEALAEEVLGGGAGEQGLPWSLYYAHEMEEGRLVAMQKVRLSPHSRPGVVRIIIRLLACLSWCFGCGSWRTSAARRTTTRTAASM